MARRLYNRLVEQMAPSVETLNQVLAQAREGLLVLTRQNTEQENLQAEIAARQTAMRDRHCAELNAIAPLATAEKPKRKSWTKYLGWLLLFVLAACLGYWAYTGSTTPTTITVVNPPLLTQPMPPPPNTVGSDIDACIANLKSAKVGAGSELALCKGAKADLHL